MIAAQPQFDVWYDKSLVGGDKFRKTIVETIKSAAYFIVLISRASAGSEWVLDEVEYAKRIHKRILPIWLEQTEIPDDMDMILQRYHSLFWYLRQSDAQFERNLLSVFGLAEQEKETGKVPVGFGNEFSEADNLRMRTLLESERNGAFAQCYAKQNACLLGCAYLFGGPCAIDKDKARFYFRIAEYHGDPDGTFYLLKMQLDDRYAQTWDDPDEAFYGPIMEKIEALSENGSVPAMLFMGNVYWYAQYGRAQDLEKSAALYEKCALLGNARAQYIMSANYYYGDGVPKDYDLAVMYANLASEQKYLKSERRWGKLYRDGLAVRQDYGKAREHYENGAKMGDYNCYNKIGDMLYYGWGFPVDYEEAFRYYQRGEHAVELRQRYAAAKSKQALGRCYELGHGTAVDLSAAADQYLEGYRLGLKECRDHYIRVSSALKREQ